MSAPKIEAAERINADGPDHEVETQKQENQSPGAAGKVDPERSDNRDSNTTTRSHNSNDRWSDGSVRRQDSAAEIYAANHATEGQSHE